MYSYMWHNEQVEEPSLRVLTAHIRCVAIHTCICMHLYVITQKSGHIHMDTLTHIHIYVSTCVYIHVYVEIHMLRYIHMYVCAYMWIWKFICLGIFTCMCVGLEEFKHMWMYTCTCMNNLFVKNARQIVWIFIFFARQYVCSVHVNMCPLYPHNIFIHISICIHAGGSSARGVRGLFRWIFVYELYVWACI